jgi:Na+(H+)/acetate symporter ActP
MGISLFARSINLAFLGSLAFAVAASTNLPVIVLGLYWHRFTARGAVAGMGVGLFSSVALILLGPNVLGDSAPFPLDNPAIVTIPLGFIAAVVGSLLPASLPQRMPAAGKVV